MRRLGVGLAVFSVTAWSTNYVVGRFLALHGADPLAVSLARFAVATPVVFLLAKFPRYRGRAGGLLLAGMLGIAAFNIALYTSLNYMTAATASLFVVLGTPLTNVLVSLLEGVPLGASTLAGGALSLAGAYLILEPYISVKSAAGPLLALAATLSWSLYTAYVKRIYEAYTPAAASAWISLAGTLAMAPAAAAARFETLWNAEAALALFYIALVPGALAYTAWNLAVEKAGPGAAASVLPLMPVITLVISAAILGESITPQQALGMALAIAGVYLSMRRGRQTKASR
ncbi:MAG: DMT family transporter [Pyrobaculum sp.]